ncbi:Transcription factor MYB29 [Bienertia sinuspersici]
MDEGSSSGGRGRNKRFWTAKEDKALINALHELSTPHWKCENGFRNGCMNHLEELIRKAIPSCGSKSSPHIDSKVENSTTQVQSYNTNIGNKWIQMG